MPLMPGMENVLGIRIPVLRRIAREIVRGDWREFVASAQIDYFEERMLHWLETSMLDDWTYNKALQKIVESLRVDAAEKQIIRTMRRGNATMEKRTGHDIMAK